VTRGSEHLC